MSYYDAYTDNDLKDQLLWCGYCLHYTPDENHYELFECGGGYQTIKPYWERSTGEIFDSIQAAHRYAIMEGK